MIGPGWSVRPCEVDWLGVSCGIRQNGIEFFCRAGLADELNDHTNDGMIKLKATKGRKESNLTNYTPFFLSPFPFGIDRNQ